MTKPFYVAKRARAELPSVAKALAGKVYSIVCASQNEAQLRHEAEKALEGCSAELSIPWTPYQIDRPLGGRDARTKFVDVSHGAVVIEYESPRSFVGKEGATLRHARSQAEEYARLLSYEEGRRIAEYVLVAWDGTSISFGRVENGGPTWERLVDFDEQAAERLLLELQQNGTPLVHPRLLTTVVGPDSEYGTRLIPLFLNPWCALKRGPEQPRPSFSLSNGAGCSAKS